MGSYIWSPVRVKGVAKEMLLLLSRESISRAASIVLEVHGLWLAEWRCGIRPSVSGVARLSWG